jgi:hypothetical protein
MHLLVVVFGSSLDCINLQRIFNRMNREQESQPTIIVSLPNVANDTQSTDVPTSTNSQSSTVPKKYRAHHPEYYRRWSRVFLECFSTFIYIFMMVALKIYHYRYAVELPLYIIPFVKAASQIFLLLLFFVYGVGYVNPVTVLGAYLTDLIHGPKSGISITRTHGLVTPHAMDYVTMLLFILAELVGGILAGVFIWIFFMNVPSTNYGFTEFDYLSFSSYFQNIGLVAFCSILIMFPKLVAPIKRATFAKHIAPTTAAAFLIAYIIANFASAGYLEFLSWFVTAVLSNVGHNGWSLTTPPVQLEGFFIMVGSLLGMVITVLLIYLLPHKYTSRRRKLE